MNIDICKLCLASKPLRQSHIFPKFVFSWMKETGSPYLRTTGNPNRREQDGRTVPLLCNECEQLFSVREKWFSENVFRTYIDAGATRFSYDGSLYYFLVSLLWRVLHSDLHDLTSSHWYLSLVQQAEQEWRAYLLDGKVPPNFADIHLFLTDLSDDGPQPVVNFNRYLTRAVDGTIASSATRCFVYAKFSRFIVLGPLTAFNPAHFVNTGIDHNGGTLVLPQEIQDGCLGEFMLDRARTQHEMTVIGMSERQKGVIKADIEKRIEELAETDLVSSILADFSAEVDPKILWPAPSDPTTPCPCGSGSAFATCHGKVQ